MSVTERVASATKPAPRPTASMSYTAVWEPSKAGEIQLYDVTYEEYRAKYDQLWGQGWRLKGLQVAVVGGTQVRYTAVWQPSTAGEIQVYGWTYEDYRKKYDELWAKGWRLKLLQPFVLAGDQVRYTAVWQPSRAGEIQVYGWTYEDYRKKYDELWGQGWRLKLLQPFVLSGNQVRYSAVWQPGTTGEIQLYGARYTDYRAKYDELWGQGWRLKTLQTFISRPAPPKIRVPKPSPDQLKQRAIDAYKADGGLNSGVGYPAGGVQLTADQAVWPMSGGRVVARANGSTAIEIDQKVRVTFIGFKCFEESSELSTSDEPYFVVSYVHAGKSVTSSFEFSKINEGQTTLVGAVIGDDFDVKTARLHVAVYEHDEGSVTTARRKVRKTMEEIAAAGAQAAAIYDVATSAKGAAGDGGLSNYAAIAGGVVGGPLGALIGKGIVGALGLGDDYVGDQGVPVFDQNYNQIPVLGSVDGPAGPVEFSHRFWIDSGNDGDYEVYFRVQKMDVPRPTPSPS